MRKATPKSPKKQSRKEKVTVPASTYLLPDPLKCEAHLSSSGERMTTLIFPQPFIGPVTHSADKYFEEARKCPAVLVDPTVWLVIMPWLRNEPHKVKKFWQDYNTAEAAQGRMRATSGTAIINWQNERILIQMAQATRRLLDSDQPAVESPALFPLEMTLLCKLGEWVMKAVENDHEAPRRLYKLLKDPTAADDKTNRDLTSRNVFAAFARLVAKEEKLPSKKAVREEAYIGSADNPRRVASRAYAKLGLSSLPRGR